MFIDLAEFLRCPRPHEDTFLVLSTGAMKERHLLFGTIGCPVCQAEFPVVEGVARFGEPPRLPVPGGPLPPSDAVQAVLGLTNPGGYVVLLGSAAALTPALGGRLKGVHLVCVNPPAAREVEPGSTALTAPDFVPLRDAVARGVVVGAEYAAGRWLAEAARVLLAGQRLVALSATVTPPAGITPLAIGQGMWVGSRGPA